MRLAVAGGSEKLACRKQNAPVFESLETRCLLSGSSHEVVIGSLAEAPLATHAPAAVVLAPAKLARTAAPLAGKAKRIVYKGPIIITKGGTYSGNWQSLDWRKPAVQIRTSQPVIIENSNIRSATTLINVFGVNANLTVRNTRGYGLNPNRKGKYPGRFLDVDGFSNIVVYNNYLQNTSGMYFYNYVGNHTAKQTLKVLRNVALNIDGRVSDGAGGWLSVAADPEQYKQFFQINGVQGLVGAEIAWNQIVNQAGKSRVEENINIHNTTGTPKSPIKIHNNYIHGAYPSNSVDAETYTGGGIMLSDNGSSYLRAYSNQIVNIGSIGLIISSGHDNWFYSNRIVSSGLSPSGVLMPYTNVGAAIWNYNAEPTFVNNGGYNNVIGWVNSDGIRNDYWMPEATTVWKGNKALPDPITKATEAAEWQIWQQSLKKYKVTVGPT